MKLYPIIVEWYAMVKKAAYPSKLNDALLSVRLKIRDYLDMLLDEDMIDDIDEIQSFVDLLSSPGNAAKIQAKAKSLKKNHSSMWNQLESDFAGSFYGYTQVNIAMDNAKKIPSSEGGGSSGGGGEDDVGDNNGGGGSGGSITIPLPPVGKKGIASHTVTILATISVGLGTYLLVRWLK